ncbi:RES domain-containing protein [Methylobacterium sp. E-005]|uniref:RES family NAD+ phosphorylase n=1 Tax=Methylobacterium sp. E-005 TaxID=2836549 RepID=UPI001FB8AEBE|nr:RES family NAD+ phosphorylase [Methylobacterium sp. E-005]MCJ2086730.1 RES domain-containing protein [Methylobacterium sp. E-005]
MPSVGAELGPVVPWKGTTYRLIPSRFPPVAVYDGLVSPDRLEALAAVEDLTNPRLRSQVRIAKVAGEDPASSTRLQNWNLAPFAYGNPEGSTFFDEERPCLEVAADPQTALAVSVARRERFLARTEEAPVGLDMRMFKTPVEGRFLDLLAYDAERLQAQARILGGRLPDDVDGILFHPVERPSAMAISVVTGVALGRTLQTSHFRYMWDGSRIALLYAFDAAGTAIKPDDLRGEEDCAIAA